MSDQISGTWMDDPSHFGRRTRREFMYVGLVGGLGLTLPALLRSEAMAAQKQYVSKEGPAKSVIHIFLPGGMAHQESFDPKPYAPAAYRGPYGSIETQIAGIRFSDKFPKIAAIAEAAGIAVIPHGGGNTPYGQHACYALPAVPWTECYVPTPPGVPLEEAVRVPGMSVPKDGTMKPSDAPGFGIEIDPANLNLPSVEDRIDSARYLTPYSDAAALMVANDTTEFGLAKSVTGFNDNGIQGYTHPFYHLGF